MIIIKHGDNISVSNEAEIAHVKDIVDTNFKSVKDIVLKSRKIVKVKHAYALDTEAQRNEQVECLMQAGGGYVTFAGFIDKITRSLAVDIITVHTKY